MSPTALDRILIALAHDAPSATIFEPIFKMARQKGAPVECVCIEDTRLFDIAGQPQARFIHAYSQESSPLNEATVSRALRVASVRTRERVEATLTRASLAWSFRTRRAALLSEAFSDATPGDLIVVPLLRGARNADQVRGLIAAITDRIAASLLVINESGAPDRSVLAVFDGDREDLAAAGDLAKNFGCPLTIFATGGDDEATQKLADEANAFLGEAGQEVAVRAIVARGGENLGQAIREAAPGTLVLDRQGATVKSLDIVSLLTECGGSLLLRN